MKYKVTGTVEYDFEVYVEAENEEEAKDEAHDLTKLGAVALGNPAISVEEAREVL